MMDAVDYTLFENPFFVIAQCRDCALPGYLILSSVQPARHLGELSAAAAAALGPALVQAVTAVQDTLHPEKMYCAQFGEATSQLHFHIFPRTKDITEAYLKEKPEQRDLIHGPVLLDWARSKYKDLMLSQQACDVMQRIRQTLRHTCCSTA